MNPTGTDLDLSIVANFAEVWLAKEGHDGVVGINFLEKVQTATSSAVLGAMLADVDYVIMGAGVPRELPALVTAYAAGLPGSLTIEVGGGEAQIASIDPGEVLGADLPAMNRPLVLAIVSLHVLAAYLNRSESIRPDGFVVEGPIAGGHSAPPRGKMVLDELGQPIYSAKDDADISAMVAVGLPFWLAGAYGSPERVAEAVAAGAQGVQVGTVFALSGESGLRPDLREELLDEIRKSELVVKNDALASPTGFPFKVAQLPGTLSDEREYAARGRICDLGYLRSPVAAEDGSVVFRCASEPVHMYVKKGGDAAKTEGRMCLCNSLMANIGLGQVRKSGYVEQPAITLGQDLSGPKRLLELYPEGWSATQALDWLLSELPDDVRIARIGE